MYCSAAILQREGWILLGTVLNSFNFISIYLLTNFFYLSVTLVIQLGLPANPEQYIHRLGRTARAGAMGRGILILSQEEKFFLKDTAALSLPIKPFSASSTQPGPTSEVVQHAHTEIQPILAAIPDEEKGKVYRSWMGYYNTFLRRMNWTKADLVREAGKLVISGFGWTDSIPPPLDPKTVGTMALKGVPGLNIVKKGPRILGGGGSDGQARTSVKVRATDKRVAS